VGARGHADGGGAVYIADGYGNHRVVVFQDNGDGTATWLRQWGAVAGTVNNPQTDSPGLFASGDGGHPHCVVGGNDGLMYVCDRGMTESRTSPRPARCSGS